MATLSKKNEATATATQGSAIPGERYEASVEEELIESEMKAWRIAVAHKDQGEMSTAEWKKVRQHDEEESMKQLEELSSRHPRTSFIKTMMGQVKHHFGKEAESAKYFEEALAHNRHEPLLTFKLAEARRLSGETKKAIEFYRETLELQSDFPEARLGLARCLLEDSSTSAEGREIISDVLKKDPDNKVALELESKSNDPSSHSKSNK